MSKVCSSICCPNDSLPAVRSNYSPKGSHIVLNDLPIYEIGDSSNVIIVAYDIYGFENGSRIKEICDQLS